MISLYGTFLLSRFVCPYQENYGSNCKTKVLSAIYLKGVDLNQSSNLLNNKDKFWVQYNHNVVEFVKKIFTKILKKYLLLQILKKYLTNTYMNPYLTDPSINC